MREEFWGQRIREALDRAGFSTLRAFLLAHPTPPYAELSDALGGVSPICVQLYAQYEARERGDPEFALRDDLARLLAAELPAGWGSDWTRRFRIYEAWDKDVTADSGPACEDAWDQLDRTAMPGWRPRGANDPVLLRAFGR